MMQRVWRIFSGFFVVVLLIALIFGIFNFRSIDDWLKLRNYTPPPDISELASHTKMTTQARHIFYVNHPELVSSATQFKKKCPTFEQTIVLGCYHSNQLGIYIYKVKDKRLNGVLEVTAAHEMLHGAYDRLSQDKKDTINQQLNYFYTHGLKDKRVLQVVKSYQKNEPDAVTNEMFSIFGTEVKRLDQGLENFYRGYFTDRSAVVAYSNRYEDEFAARRAKLVSYEEQLNSLKQSIKRQETSLISQGTAIEAERRRLDSLRAQGKVDEYNNGVASFNSAVADYNQAVTRYRVDVEDYNGLLIQYKQLAGELQQLYEALSPKISSQSNE